MLGDDELQIKLAVLGVIIGIVVSAMLPIVFQAPNATGYTLEEITRERTNLEAYTGESMISQAPFMLAHVYTPYVVGDDFHVSDYGWLYGEELVDGDGNPYYAPETAGRNQIGLTTGIHLDPTKKSNVPLYQSTYTSMIQTQKMKWYYGDEDGNLGLLGAFAQWVGWDLYDYEERSFPAWNFSGLRYEFDPMLRIATSEDKRTVDDASLSIVWYDLDGQEGISGGLVLYDSKSNGIVANYSAQEIVSTYNISAATASAYTLNFDGTKVRMFIQFDPDVKISGASLEDAWTAGKWTLAFSAVSADAYLDIQGSNTFSGSVGNILSTYLDIMTLDVPNLSLEWNLVLWVICTLPVMMAVLLFLSRFGLKGVAGGILAVALGGALGGLV